MARKPADRVAVDDEGSCRGLLRRVMDGPSQKSYRGRLGRREVYDQRDRPRACSPAALDEAATGEHASRVGAIAHTSAIRSSRRRTDHRNKELSGDADFVAISRSDFRW